MDAETGIVRAVRQALLSVSFSRKLCAWAGLAPGSNQSAGKKKSVKITRADGTVVTTSDIGVGPVNAAVNAIRKAVNEDMTLEEYKLSAITGGSDSMCQVAVTVKNVQGDGNMSFGRAVGPDIVETSVNATMAAINKDFARIKNYIHPEE